MGDVLEGTYQNDPKLCIEALKTLGIAKPGLDNLSLLNLARNFLDDFNSTLEKNGTYANDLSPEEYRAHKRAKRAKLGRDLFSIGTDTPLLLPASTRSYIEPSYLWMESERRWIRGTT